MPPMMRSFLGEYHIPRMKQRMTPATQPIEKPFPKSSIMRYGQGCYLIDIVYQPELYQFQQQQSLQYSKLLSNNSKLLRIAHKAVVSLRWYAHFATNEYSSLNIETISLGISPTESQPSYVICLVILIYDAERTCWIIIQMQKRPIGYQPGKPSVLDVKVQKTNKYDHVESKLAGKIGTTVKDIEFMSNKEASKKKGELFRRIKPSTLWKLINQEQKVESIYEWNKPEEDARSQTSNFTSVTIKTQQLPVGLETDFLLIDLREPEEYEKYHIKEALSFPGTHIKRDKYIPQLYNYKNKEGKVIVIYHFDQKPGIQYTTQLVEKGYDNLLLLNGGIQGFGQEIQEGLEGKEVPQFSKKQQVKKFKKTRPQ